MTKKRSTFLLIFFAVALPLIILFLMAGGPKEKEELVIQIWPGSYEENYVKYVIEPFEEKFNADVITTPAGEWYTMAKIEEEVASDSPTLDIAQVTVSDYMRGEEMGVWEKLNLNNIPEHKNVYKQFVADYGIGFETYEMGIIYNKNTGKPKPKRLKDLWNTQYTVSLMMGHDQYLIPMFNHMITGRWTPVDLDAIFRELDKLKPNILTIMASDADLRNLIANNEIDLTEDFNNRVGNMIDEGMDVEYVTFLEAFVGVDYWGIVKGSKHKDLAEKFINFTIAEEAQRANVMKQYLGPTNMNVKLDAAFVEKNGVAYGDRLKGKPTMDDYLYISKYMDEWTERYSKWLAGF